MGENVGPVRNVSQRVRWKVGITDSVSFNVDEESRTSFVRAADTSTGTGKDTFKKSNRNENEIGSLSSGP